MIKYTYYETFEEFLKIMYLPVVILNYTLKQTNIQTFTKLKYSYSYSVKITPLICIS